MADAIGRARPERAAGQRATTQYTIIASADRTHRIEHDYNTLARLHGMFGAYCGPANPRCCTLEQQLPAGEARWLVTAERSVGPNTDRGMDIAFLSGYYGIRRHRALAQLVYPCQRFAEELQKPVGHQDPTALWPDLADDGCGYLLYLYRWRHDVTALAAAYRYATNGAPADGRSAAVTGLWRFNRDDLIAVAAGSGADAEQIAGDLVDEHEMDDPDMPPAAQVIHRLRIIERGHNRVLARGAHAIALEMIKLGVGR